MPCSKKFRSAPRFASKTALFVTILLAISTAIGSPALANESPESIAEMDQRVLAISQRLTVRNTHRCAETMPAVGLQLHSRDQYSRSTQDRLSELFPGDGLLGAQTVLSGGAANAAGLPQGATILSINGWTPALTPDRQVRLVAHDHLASLPVDAPVAIRWTLGDGEKTAMILPVAACRVLVELVQSDKRFARSSGPIIQVSSKFVSMLDDNQLAAVLAHELAHTVLKHRKQMEEAGVKSGLFSELGKSGRLRREAEIEADRVSLHLLKDAGYDPAVGPEFWRSKAGKRASRGLFRSRKYPSASKRAKLMDEELARMSQNDID